MYYILFMIGIISSLNLFAQEEEPIIVPSNTSPNIIEKTKPAEVRMKQDLKDSEKVQEQEQGPGKRQGQVGFPIEEELAPAIDQNLLMEQTIQEHLLALRVFDPSKAYYAYTSSDFQKTVPLDVFKKFIKDNNVLFSNKSFSLGNVVFSGIVATVKGTLVSSDGKALKVEYDMIQENGSWKIRKINIMSFSR